MFRPACLFLLRMSGVPLLRMLTLAILKLHVFSPETGGGIARLAAFQ